MKNKKKLQAFKVTSFKTHNTLKNTIKIKGGTQYADCGTDNMDLISLDSK